MAAAPCRLEMESTQGDAGSLGFLKLVTFHSALLPHYHRQLNVGWGFIYLKTFMALHESLVKYQLPQNLLAQECVAVAPRTVGLGGQARASPQRPAEPTCSAESTGAGGTALLPAIPLPLGS